MPDNLDLPIWGAEAIAQVANLLKRDGSPDDRRAFYMLETGAIDGSKVGHEKRGRWVSTRRRIYKSLGIEAAAEQTSEAHAARNIDASHSKKRSAASADASPEAA
jgi:hypothetical protein